MSRIGNRKLTVPAGITVEINGQEVTDTENEKLKSAAELTEQRHQLEIKNAIADEKEKYLEKIEELRSEKEKLIAENYELKMQNRINNSD
mgnify:CR=1 FL=1